MRYEDASQAGSITTGSEPIARPDVETLPPSSNGPGSGNAISGMGTNSGASGADQVADGPAVIVELRGAGGAGASSGNGFEAAGQYGTLSMDTTGNFNYVRTNPADGVQDVFQYTLADAKGARSSTTLTVEIPRVIDEQAMVNLPAGVQMSDIRVVGRDLVIQMPDGSQMVIPGGAVFVPELTIGDVQIPPTNLAALLIDSEPQPAAGPPQSSGGNFADAVPDLDPGVPLGDLIPPTELDYTPPDYEEPMEIEDTEPTIIITTPDNPAGAVNAVAVVDESGLPERPGEPEGTLEPQDIETTTGTIVFTAEDGLETLTINDVAITAVGQEIEGEHGILTITSIDLDNGVVGYSYTATDNTTDGVDDFEDFTVVVTDEDGDTATGTLHIDILDDEPLAEDDVDIVDLQTNTATGNVMTGIGTNAGAASGDTVGADDATLTAIAGEGGSDSTFDADGNLVVDGEFGTLTIDAEGNYTYVPFADAPGGTEDVFTYTLTDGDGDVITATLTIINPDQTPTAGNNPVVQLDDDVLGGNPGGTNDDANSVNATGTLSGAGGDGDLTFDLLTTGAPEGFSYVDGPNGSILVQQVQDGVTVTVLTITVDAATGEYSVVQNANILHPDGQTENNVVFTVNYTVTDGDGDVASSTLTVNVDDDTPLAFDDTETMTENETFEEGNVITGVGTNEGTANADRPGADGFAGIVGLSHANGNSDSSATGGFVVEGQFGTLTMDANGEYEYVRDPNSDGGGEDVFTYTYVDGDGDTVTATLTIEVPENDTGPVITLAEDVTVDEDGLTSIRNLDEGQGAPDPVELAGGNDAEVQGEIKVDFGNDLPAPGDIDDAIVLVDNGSLDDQLVDLDGNLIKFDLDVNGNLVGRADTDGDGEGDGPALITISVLPGATTSGSVATYTYQVTLHGPIGHAEGDDTEAADVLLGVDFTVTDSDGTPVSGSVDVTIFDDVPSAEDVLVVQPAEEQGDAVEIDINSSIEPGADGVDLVDGVTVSNLSGTGTLTYNDDGTFTYEPGANEEGTVTFDYTIVDGDGDSITRTVEIRLASDTAPQFDPPPALAVDEDGLGTANNDNGGTLATESDNGADLTDSDTFVVNFGDDVPADLESAIAFDLDSVNGKLTQDGKAIVFKVVGDSIVGQVEGSGPAVVTIAITGAVDNGDGTVTYTYGVTLAGPVDQTNDASDQTEAGITLTVGFDVTDSDNSTTPGSLNVVIYDDVPDAVADTDEVNEGSTSTGGNVILGTGGDGEAAGADAKGADGAEVTAVTGSKGTDTVLENGEFEVEGTYGILTIKPDGTYTYELTPAGVAALEAQGAGDVLTDTFTYTLTDADGDFDTANLVISLNGANDPPDVTGATVRVSEEGIVYDNDPVHIGGNPDTVGHPAQEDDQTNLATINGQLDVSDPDGDPVTVTLSDPPLDLTACGHEVYWEANLENNVLTAYADIDGTKTEIMVISIENDGSYTVELKHGVDHDPALGETDLDFDITVNVSDGTTTSTANLNITVEDDSPIAFNPTDAEIDNEAGPESADIPLNFLVAAGGDGVGDVVFDPDLDNTLARSDDGKTLQYKGENITYNVLDPHTLQGINADGELAFTIRLDPETDSYTIDLEGPIYNVSQTTFKDVTGIKGGNEDVVALTASTSGETTNDILITGNGSVNTNDKEIGIATGNDVGAGDEILFEFKSNITPDGMGGFNDDGYYQAFEYIQKFETVNPAGADPDAAAFTITITNALGTAPGNVTVTVYDGDPNAGGNPVPGAVFFSNDDGTVVVPDGYVLEDYYIVVTSTDPFTGVEYSNSTANDFKLGAIQVEVANTLEEFDVTVPITGTDCDDDAVDSTIDITFNPVDANALAATSTLAAESESTSQAKTADMSSLLVASNDNGDNAKAFVAGNQAALMGVIAAAGLEVSGKIADARALVDDVRGGSIQAEGGHKAAVVDIESDGGQAAVSVASLDAPAAAVSQMADSGAANDSADAGGAELDSANDDAGPAVSALAEGTDSSGPAEASAMTAAAVAMPSMEMVAALEAADQSVAASDAASVAQNQEVGRVLAEALAGGSGPDIDALVDAIGGGNAAAEAAHQALASVQAAGVSIGHSGGAWAFANGHAVFSMDALAVHHDATPA